ncbi:hypothetical protein EBZ38_02140 [bacterium]|nr:hypothetical protein [bacterium]
MESYMNIFLTQLFQTLGTISAVVLSSAVSIPMFSYYNKKHVLSIIRAETQEIYDRLETLECKKEI